MPRFTGNHVEGGKLINKNLYGIYSAGGYGREVMPLAKHLIAKLGVSADRLVFIDDHPSADRINGCRVLTYENFLSESAADRNVAVAIADGVIRKKLAEQCIRDCVKQWFIKAENSICMDEIEIAEGAIISPFVTLTSNIQIGKNFHANIYSYVAHDCVIGDYVTLAPAVKCNGNVHIEDHAYIGAGAIIKQGSPGAPIVIGKGAVIGMGAVVTRSVPPEQIVIGNPARPLRSPR